MQFQVIEARGLLHDEDNVRRLWCVALNARAFAVSHGLLAVDFTAYTVARHPEFNSGLFALLDIGSCGGADA